MYTIPISRYKICTPPWGYRTSLTHLFLHSKNFITFPLADKFNQWKCLAILHRVNGRVYLRRPNSHLHYFAFNVLLFQSWPWDCFYNLHNLLYEQSVIYFRKMCLCLHSYGPFWIISTENQWEIIEVRRLSCFIDFFVWFHIVCDRYTSDYAHFTFSDTIWPLSLSSDFGTRSCTHTDTAS